MFSRQRWLDEFAVVGNLSNDADSDGRNITIATSWLVTWRGIEGSSDWVVLVNINNYLSLPLCTKKLPLHMLCSSKAHWLRTRIIITPLLITSSFNHAIHSRILHHCEYFFTVTGLGISFETLQSCTELGAKAGGKCQTTFAIKGKKFIARQARRMEL